MKNSAANWADHVLSGVASLLAVYSASMGIKNTYAAALFPIIIIVGYLVSFTISLMLRRTRWIGADGWLYLAIAIYAIARQSQLNGLLPNEGFELKLRYAGVLCWMLSLGSFFTWRDQSLLFQSVPAIALFGLVGAWNTFAGSKILFFGFLLCVATLFARSHFRAMRERASQAGTSNPSELAAGPWKWMAGPEWAFGTAAAVIFISLIGAPLLQNSVKSVSGVVTISAPIRALAASAASSTYGTQPGTLNIGQGPRSVSTLPVLRAKLDRQRYLRSATYDVYTGRGWLSANHNRILPTNKGNRSTPPGSDGRPYNPSKYIKNAQINQYEIGILFGEHPRLYLPGEAWELPRDGLAPIMLRDGSVSADRPYGPGAHYSGSALVPPDDATPQKAGRPYNLPDDFPNEFLVQDNISARVRSLALNVTRNATTDFQAASLIQSEIERRCKYNLEAQATPREADPLEFFLFDSNEGYCDLFASAMCAMARSAGLPARIGLGFYPNDPKRDDEGYFVVREADYHVWAEVFFENVGWVPFDPTEGAESVGESRRGTSLHRSEPFYTLAWFRNVLNGAIAAMLLAALFTSLSIVYSLRNPSNPKTAAELEYVKFESLLSRHYKKQRRLYQTPSDYIESLAITEPEKIAAIKQLCADMEKHLFGPAAPTRSEVTELKIKLAAITKLLKS